MTMCMLTRMVFFLHISFLATGLQLWIVSSTHKGVSSTDMPYIRRDTTRDITKKSNLQVSMFTQQASGPHCAADFLLVDGDGRAVPVPHDVILEVIKANNPCEESDEAERLTNVLLDKHFVSLQCCQNKRLAPNQKQKPAKKRTEETQNAPDITSFQCDAREMQRVRALRVHNEKLDDPPNPHRLRVMQYNILAENLFAKMEKRYTSHYADRKRDESVITQIVAWNPDIVTMQEVQERDFKLFVGKLKNNGYKTLENWKTIRRSISSITSSLAWSSDRVELADHVVFTAKDELSPESNCIVKAEGVQWYKYNAVVALFQMKTTRKSFIAMTSHLIAPPDKADVKALQTFLFVRHLERVVLPAWENQHDIDSTTIPMVLALDANSEEFFQNTKSGTSGFFELMSTGTLLPPHGDRKDSKVDCQLLGGEKTLEIDWKISPWRSIYGSNDMVWTAMDFREDYSFYGVIDWIWVKNTPSKFDGSNPKHMVTQFDNFAKRIPEDQNNIPDENNPSDHLPLIAEWTL